MFTSRGPQRPKFKQKGINVFSLIKFLKECEHVLDINEEKESSYRFAMLRQYFERDFEEGKPLKYEGKALGFYAPEQDEARFWIRRK